ncbi:hypothetical protein KI688_008020 [Linnemannia hyalina]|uniref:Carboxylesterase type B domain-containing protein n=1 Tax=Linnemannia hyalina TaxID=64524 RepID=A0A9P7Y2V4_9FUNG|nr:hypothetical protein KI688_008020 [Linnemannia hyalina]
MKEIIRALLLLLAFANLCALFAGLQILSPYDYAYQYNFQETSHLALNTFLFLAVVYSFLGRAEWSGVTRITTGLVLTAWCLTLNVTDLKNIQDEGGCVNGKRFNPVEDGASSFAARTRCQIQVVISSLSVIWAALLIAELFMTRTHRKRNMVKFGLDRPTELDVMPQTIHVYQPDMSLNAGENNALPATATGTATTVESETLPAYEPRSTGPRVHIIDLTRVARGPPATTATATGAQLAPGTPGTESATGAPLPPPPSILDKNNKVVKFLNVPFGLIEERWRPAAKAKSWDGIRDATKLGPMPPQRTTNNPFMSTLLGVPDKYVFDKDMNERDCLNCNIFMPASAVGCLDEKKRLPVLVWLFGGGMRTGSNAIPLYELILDAQEHAKTVPECQKKWYDLSVGNWGLLDQVFGLEWIQDHIQAFSGNPKRVTVMGQSAGASSISYLQLIPECRGLFHRSILVSGTVTTLVAQYPEQEGQRIFDRLCSNFNVPSDLPPLEKVARLREVPAEAISDAINKATDVMFRPCVDGVVFKQDCRLIVGDTSLYDPDLNWVFAGTCGDEGTMIVEELGASTVADFEPFKRRVCDPADHDLFDQIFGVPSTDAEAYSISSRLLNSGVFRFPTFEVSEAILAHPTCQLSRFHMDTVIHKIDNMIPGWGAHHGVDLPFTFGGESTVKLLSDEEREMSRKVQAVWVEVVTAASPEASSLPLVNCVLPRTVNPHKKEKEKEKEVEIVIEGDGNGIVVVAAEIEEEEAVVFSRDLRVTRGPVERMTSEEIGFWRRSAAYAVKQAAEGRAEVFGFVLSPPLRSSNSFKKQE